MSTTSKKASVVSFAEPPTTPPPNPSAVVYPEVMTEAEVIQFLRLDLIGIRNPSETLSYYRRRGLLRGTQIGKCIRYRRTEVERFLDTITEQNPR